MLKYWGAQDPRMASSDGEFFLIGDAVVNDADAANVAVGDISADAVVVDGEPSSKGGCGCHGGGRGSATAPVTWPLDDIKLDSGECSEDPSRPSGGPCSSRPIVRAIESF